MIQKANKASIFPDENLDITNIVPFIGYLRLEVRELLWRKQLVCFEGEELSNFSANQSAG